MSEQSRKCLPDDCVATTRRFELSWPNDRTRHVRCGCGRTLESIDDEDKTIRFYATVNMYEDGRPGGITIGANKMGDHTHGMINMLAMAASLALQYGAPIEEIIAQWRYTKFPPEGFTMDKDYPRCTSMPDLIAQWLEARFVIREEKPGK